MKLILKTADETLFERDLPKSVNDEIAEELEKFNEFVCESMTIEFKKGVKLKQAHDSNNLDDSTVQSIVCLLSKP